MSDDSSRRERVANLARDSFSGTLLGDGAVLLIPTCVFDLGLTCRPIERDRSTRKIRISATRVNETVITLGSICWPMLFPRLFKQSVARTPDEIAVVDLESDVEYTYVELADQVYSATAALRDRGVQKGDRVAICMGNRPENVVTYLATQFLGAVAVPFNFRLPAGEITYHLEDSDPDILFFDDMSRDAVIEATPDIDVSTVYVGDDDPDSAERFEEFTDTSGDEPEIDVSHEDRSTILYSSGTTGDPKGIPIDHENTTARIMINSLGQGYYLGETILGAMPLYHTVGLHGVLGCVLGLSGTYLTMPRFDPERYTRAIEEYEVTALHEAPTIFQNMLDSDAIEEVSVDTVQTVGFSGAPMSTSTFQAIIDRFDPDHFANLYGTTEVYGTLAYVDLRDADDPSVVGPANVFIETRIAELSADDPENTVEPGEEGELIVNTDSPASFDGYYNKPEQTKRAIHDGWFFTGDAAYETDDGNIVLTGRADDMIISGGENIHPSNVKDVLSTHPNVTDVGIVGVEDEEWGEIVVAFVRRDGDVTADELDKWCIENDDLPDFKRPRRYEFVDELPRNPSGKVLRYELRDRLSE